MSRSYKKLSIIGDIGIRHGNKSLSPKRMHHGKVRTKVRNELTSGKDYDELDLPTSRGNELTNPYDICDWYYLPQEGENYYAKGKRK